MKNFLPTLILLSAVFFLWGCQTTNDPASNANTFPVNQEIISEEGEPILVGQLNREAWQMEAYKAWFDDEYTDKHESFRIFSLFHGFLIYRSLAFG
jgi:hypothetical protein